MSLVVVGMSHHTASVELLEQVVLGADGDARLSAVLDRSEQVSEHLLLSTCNRVEVYAEAMAFHGAVTDISEALAQVTGVPIDELRDHLYVHYEDRAVAHLFSVASGLDSVAVGESQILGQLREALQLAQRTDHLGSSLSSLAQQALRVGKQAHSDTDIDKVSRSLVQRALERASDELGSFGDRRAVVVGAGAMSGLAAHTVRRAGFGDVVVVNRTPQRARRLASAIGGSWRPWDELVDAVAQADLVISCTGAVGYVIDEKVVPRSAGDTVLIDLGLPRDVDPVLADREGLTLISLESLGGRDGVEGSEREQVRQVEQLVTGAVADFLVRRREAAIIPTVTALRAQSSILMDAELARLEGRLDLTEHDLDEVRLAMHRVVEKILHTPTVRMKQLAGKEGGADVADLLRQLFDLDPHESRVSRLPKGGDLA